ncbi:hypothetical protein IWX49DRAFT_644413 [Phyllosticta citricarpa]
MGSWNIVNENVRRAVDTTDVYAVSTPCCLGARLTMWYFWSWSFVVDLNRKSIKGLLSAVDFHHHQQTFHRLRSAAIFAKLPSLDSIVSSTSRKNAFQHEARPCCPSGLDFRGCCRSWPAQVGIFSRICSASEDLCFALLHGRAQDHLLDGQVQRRRHRNQDCPSRHHQNGSQQRDRGRHDPLHDRNCRDQAVHDHQAICRDLDQEQSHHQDLHRGRQHEQGHHGRQERDQPQRRPQDDPDGRDQALHHRFDD